jgi:hypothetical protein
MIFTEIVLICPYYTIGTQVESRILFINVLIEGLCSFGFPVCAKMPTNVTPAPENGAPRSELQELQLKAGQVTDEVSKLKQHIHNESLNSAVPKFG